MEVLREGSVAHRCEFHGKALARRTNAVEFFRPRLSLPGSAPGCQPHFLGRFRFQRTKPAFKAGFAGMPAQVGMTP